MILEQEIREALKQRLLRYGADSSLLSEELAVLRGRAVADVVNFTSKPHCFEIKSDRDTVKRLKDQSYAYAKVFPKVSLVTTDSMLERAFPLIPSWWGILIAKKNEKKTYITSYRKAKPNLSFSENHFLQLIWNERLENELKSRNRLPKKGLKRALLAELLSEELPAHEIFQIARDFVRDKKAAS